MEAEAADSSAERTRQQRTPAQQQDKLRLSPSASDAAGSDDTHAPQGMQPPTGQAAKVDEDLFDMGLAADAPAEVAGSTELERLAAAAEVREGAHAEGSAAGAPAMQAPAQAAQVAGGAAGSGSAAELPAMQAPAQDVEVGRGAGGLASAGGLPGNEAQARELLVQAAKAEEGAIDMVSESEGAAGAAGSAERERRRGGEEARTAPAKHDVTEL